MSLYEWLTVCFEGFVALLLFLWFVMDRCNWYFLEEKDDEEDGGG